MSKARRSPRRHVVHTTDPRYQVTEFARGNGEVPWQNSRDWEMEDPSYSFRTRAPTQELLNQLHALDPLWKARFSVKRLVDLDGQGLKLIQRMRGKQWRNIQIKYNKGTDSYDVDAYSINSKTLEAKKVYDVQDIYAENLIDVIGYATEAK